MVLYVYTTLPVQFKPTPLIVRPCQHNPNPTCTIPSLPTPTPIPPTPLLTTILLLPHLLPHRHHYSAPPPLPSTQPQPQPHPSTQPNPPPHPSSPPLTSTTKHFPVLASTPLGPAVYGCYASSCPCGGGSGRCGLGGVGSWSLRGSGSGRAVGAFGVLDGVAGLVVGAGAVVVVSGEEEWVVWVGNGMVAELCWVFVALRYWCWLVVLEC